MFLSEATVFISSCLDMYTTLFGRRQVCRWAATPGKTTIGKKVASPLKTHWGKRVGRIFQCPLAELGVLPSPVFAVYLRMMMMIVVAVMVTMVMMDGPHCPWVIYNNDAVQCS